MKTVASGEPHPLSVLFIGNSYTFFNRMPEMLEALARGSKGPTVRASQHTIGGCSLSRHWRRTGARTAIRRGRWDRIVLQDHSLMPIHDPECLSDYAERFGERIQAAGAQAVLYLTWARQYAPATQRHITQAYLSAAARCKADVAPVGEAWKRAFAARKGLVLHTDDKSHPNPAGSYLAACVFFATLLGRSPEGLPGRLLSAKKNAKGRRDVLTNLSRSDAAFFQRVAWRTVRQLTDRSDRRGNRIARGVKGR